MNAHKTAEKGAGFFAFGLGDLREVGFARFHFAAQFVEEDVAAADVADGLFAGGDIGDVDAGWRLGRGGLCGGRGCGGVAGVGGGRTAGRGGWLPGAPDS